MHTLYNMQNSGNCYKLRLAMTQLAQPYRLEDIDILKGESRTPAFLAMNPNGRIPLLQLADGRFLPESNAALYYLAEGTPLLPDDRFERAQTLQWMFFEQYSHEPYIAVARFWRTLVADGETLKRDRFPEWMERGHAALGVMDQYLAERAFFAGSAYSIADIALYAYTHMAEDGGFDLSGYAGILGWLERINGQPGHIDIHHRPG